jgi:hypothetical protein
LKLPGIPIYVNPRGLAEAGQRLDFSVAPLNLRQSPVRVILEQALSGSGLSFIVRDGFLSIDSRSAVLEIRVKEIERKLDRVLESLQRLEKAK